MAVLREAGIEPVVKMAGDRLAAGMSGKDYLVDRVLVPAADAERARELLAVRGFPSGAASADEASFEEEATGIGSRGRERAGVPPAQGLTARDGGRARRQCRCDSQSGGTFPRGPGAGWSTGWWVGGARGWPRTSASSGYDQNQSSPGSKLCTTG